MKKSYVIKITFIFLLLLGIIFMAGIAWKDYQVEQDKKRMEAMYSQILEGASTAPQIIKVDYQSQLSTGQPLIFGGSHSPMLEHSDAWDKMQEVGVTMIRLDLAMNYMIRNTNLEFYINNVADIQNIENWNTFDLKKINSRLSMAKSKNMKTIGIIDYTPPWLSYDGTDFGVPKDWNVFEDIVKKTYKYHRAQLDYVEIWNEANHSHFLKTTNSGLSKPEAYKKIYYHATKAIREVDAEANDGKITPIGGPVDPDPKGAHLLRTILEDSNLSKNLDFISYHNYYTQEPSWNKYKEVAKEFNRSELPYFITEWNIDGKNEVDNPFKTSTPAIYYTGNKFIDFLKMGLGGANYYSLLPIKENAVYLGFYKWENGGAELLPQAKTWRLMSKNMKLGKGESQIYDFQANDSDINGLGFKNVDGQYGVVLTNKSTESKLSRLNLANLGLGKYAKVDIYYASADNDATTPVYTGEVKKTKDGMELLVYMPQESVVGVLLSDDKNWFDFVNLPY